MQRDRKKVDRRPEEICSRKKGALAASGSDTEQGLIGRLRVKVEMILTNVTY